MRWTSPITIESLTGDMNKLSNTACDSMRETLFFLECRPQEKGKTAVLAISQDVKSGEGRCERVAEEFNVMCQVHEYGGGPLTSRNGQMLFTDKTSTGGSNVIYQASPTSPFKVLIDSATHKVRTNFGDFNIHPSGKFAVAIKEEHFSHSSDDVVNSLAFIDLATGVVFDIAKGFDFYVSPRFSPDGSKLVWVSWNHPAMQWNESALYGAWVSSTGQLTIHGQHQITTKKESISRPVWGTNDTVYFASDISGFYNLQSYDFSKKKTIVELTHVLGDVSSPDWLLGWNTFDVLKDGKIIAAFNENGETFLAIVDPLTKSLTKIDEVKGKFTTIEEVRVCGDVLYFLARADLTPHALFSMDLQSPYKTRAIRKSSNVEVDPAFISYHQNIQFPTKDGYISHAIYYPPKNPNFSLKSGVPPPLLLHCHGGPTANANAGMDLKIQFWTSRGFAFADVNYGGSSGYGKKHRDRLDGNWGIVDVNDACDCADYLVQKGLAHKDQLAIDGGSAGGYTTLACLSFRPDIFKAGCSQYGVASLESLAKLTHKFEAHYLESLLGGTVEDHASVYYDRSPLHFAHQIKAPLLVQQGSEDRVVPPNQAELIVEAVKKIGGVVEYQLFQGEGHGFRGADAIKAQFERELAFYQRIFKL